MDHDPKRLQEQDDRLGRALRTARSTLAGPGQQALARVQERLEARRARPRAWVVQLASAAALFLLVASAAAGTTYGIQVLAAWQRESIVVPPPIPEPTPPRRPDPKRAVPALPVPPPDPTPELPPAPTPELVSPPAPKTAVVPVRMDPKPATPVEPDPLPLETPRETPPPPVVAQAPAESALAAESRLLGAALRQLRQERDANRALQTLDRLRAEHPTGSLVDEADFARVEALTSLGRTDEALREIERLEPRVASGSVRRAQLVLLRGELLAGAGRFGEALPFFDELVAGGGATLERALFGRATARSRLGDLSGSRADLQRCLELFPQGAFAERARTALAR